MTFVVKWLPLKQHTQQTLTSTILMLTINSLESVRIYNNMVTDISCSPCGSWIVSKKMTVPWSFWTEKYFEQHMGQGWNTHSAISTVLTKSMIIRIHTTRGNTCWTEKTGMGWTHLQNGWIEFTTENLRRNNRLCSNRPVVKPKNWWRDAVTRDDRKLLGSAARRLTLDRKLWGRKAKKASAGNWAVIAWWWWWWWW